MVVVFSAPSPAALRLEESRHGTSSPASRRPASGQPSSTGDLQRGAFTDLGDGAVGMSLMIWNTPYAAPVLECEIILKD